MVRHILVPFDDSPPSHLALEYALAEYPEDKITFLYVLDPADIYDDVGAGAIAGGDTAPPSDDEQAVIQKTREKITDHSGTVATETLSGNPSGVIIEYAEEHDVDQIVIGSHGRTGVSRVLLGSVAENIVRKAPVPVTVVR